MSEECDHGNVNTVGWGIDANGQAFVIGGCPTCGDVVTENVTVVAVPAPAPEAK